jgi:hypothetical protein
VYRGDPGHAPLTGAFEHWDASLLRNIAQYGYFSPNTMPNNTNMFPGFPLTLAAVHLILRNWTLSELAVSGIAGCFAMVSLSRLAGNRRAVLYQLTMPAAVVIGTQTFYESGPRTLLVLFPVCIALASLETRRPWLRYLYFGISAPLAAVMGLLFLAGQWTG